MWIRQEVWADWAVSISSPSGSVWPTVGLWFMTHRRLWLLILGPAVARLQQARFLQVAAVRGEPVVRAWVCAAPLDLAWRWRFDDMALWGGMLVA